MSADLTVVCVAVFPTVTEDPITKQHVGILIGILAAVIMLLMLVIFIITVRHRQRKHTTPHAILKPIGTADNRVTINMKDLALQYQPKYALNGNIYGQVNLDDPDKLLYHEPADFKTPIYPATYSNGERPFQPRSTATDFMHIVHTHQTLELSSRTFSVHVPVRFRVHVPDAASVPTTAPVG